MMTPIYLGTRKGLFKYSGGRITALGFEGVHMPMLLPDRRDGSVLAVAEHGHFGSKVHRSRDGGASWDEVGTPTYPEQPEGAPDDLCPMRKTPIPWSLEKIWSLESGGDDRPGRLWCGTLPGGLFRSDDHGDSWELVRALWDRPERKQWFGGGYDFPGIHSICVDPRDSDTVRVAVSCGGVWVSKDAGASWECKADGMRADYLPPELAGDPNTQDPHRMVQGTSDPDTFWVQHHCGIFRSTDACESWHAIDNARPSGFGFGVAVDPHDAATAWFVPGVKDEVRIPVDARFVVTRTRDGGATFESLADGLPPGDAYHLVYRHGLEIDPAGQRLAIGSTTGSVWLSDDRGERWERLTSDLPPVMCVRFG